MGHLYNKIGNTLEFTTLKKCRIKGTLIVINQILDRCSQAVNQTLDLFFLQALFRFLMTSVVIISNSVISDVLKFFFESNPITSSHKM